MVMRGLYRRLQSLQETTWANTIACSSLPCWKTAGRLARHGNQQAYDALTKIPEPAECHRVTGDPCVIMQAAVERRVPLGHLDSKSTRSA